MNTNLTLPIRQALIGLGPLIAALGLMDEAAWAPIANQSAVVLGLMSTVGGVAWQWRVSRAAAKVAQVAALPGVTAVIASDPKLAAAAETSASSAKSK